MTTVFAASVRVTGSVTSITVSMAVSVTTISGLAISSTVAVSLGTTVGFASVRNTGVLSTESSVGFASIRSSTVGFCVTSMGKTVTVMAMGVLETMSVTVVGDALSSDGNSGDKSSSGEFHIYKVFL